MSDAVAEIGEVGEVEAVEEVDVVVVGAGQAGIAMSEHLSDHGIEVPIRFFAPVAS